MGRWFSWEMAGIVRAGRRGRFVFEGGEDGGSLSWRWPDGTSRKSAGCSPFRDADGRRESAEGLSPFCIFRSSDRSLICLLKLVESVISLLLLP